MAPRGRPRQLGVLLGIGALLIQLLVPIFHRPALAAGLPYDPAAWCIGGAAAPAGTDNSDRPAGQVPRHAAYLCPICQTLQANGHALTPAAPVPVVSHVAASVILPWVAPAPLARPEGTRPNPRAPPASG